MIDSPSWQTQTAQGRLRVVVVALAAALAVGLILHREEPQPVAGETTTTVDDPVRGMGPRNISGAAAGVGSQPRVGRGVTIRP